ncbi:MAG TPA: response regulator transcription factor [Candidatus Marinimicrobia bacterium]|jgi:DNA-binding NarL/FixJ family response regulator|nr:response regulator transcription factor [Candidatus Neomarinimicrobiota bacterium]HPY00893.1 response regulator transcription factor [Candidatus Neomarinimicrobiota bacterium]HQC62850.1 response regulator transcription factor [Candidatus Neomarinimicrobiota bacterium]
MINLLIVDDHPLIRQGLRQTFLDTNDIRVSGEASDSAYALAEIENHNYDAVILDLSLPGRSGLDLLKQIKNLSPSLPVLILSVFPESQYAIRVLKAGADGYISKESHPDELIHAVRKIVTGGKYISPTLAEKLANSLTEATQNPTHEILSDREFQTMLAIASGKTVKEIAAELNLSVKTISTYRTRILRKMHLKNNAEIICYAVRLGLVQ